MKKISLFIICFLCIGGLVWLLSIKPVPKNNILGNAVIRPSEKLQSTRKEEAVFGTPVRLVIPSIQVDASVELVGLDTGGNMDIPKHNENVAWYKLGYRPGETGNAVFAGHLDTKTGAPAVFWHLAQLKNGDSIIVYDENGRSLIYSVTQVANYLYDDFPTAKVFGSSDKQRLNLITCGGTWNERSQIYSQRTVVFSSIEKN